MNKNIFSILSLVLLLFAATSCEKDPIGGTATQDTAGDWYVTMAALTESGEVIDEDFFGLGNFHVITFNTADDKSNEMWISDLENNGYFPFQCKINVNTETATFQAEGSQNILDDNKVTITGGKIVKGGAITPSGQKADAIEFFVSFDNDPYPAAYGYKHYKISGYRYTGFVADE